YIYNALGQLVEKSGSGGTTVLMYDEAGHLVGEYTGSGALIQETIWMGDTIFVPLSAYSDLGDVKSASLDPTTHGFTLNLHGGNTATSYDATLIFDQERLMSRTVTLREFPERRERDSYSFPKRSRE
ncbi:MAG: hypothetical protein QOF32_1065, partial [Gammaproteobacteria bacterium]|nr:hypothetical protein [Gammaproteobacteria bacterium]